MINPWFIANENCPNKCIALSTKRISDSWQTSNGFRFISPVSRRGANFSTIQLKNNRLDTFFRNSKSYGNFMLFNTSVIAINLLSTPAWPCSLVTVTGSRAVDIRLALVCSRFDIQNLHHTASELDMNVYWFTTFCAENSITASCFGKRLHCFLYIHATTSSRATEQPIRVMSWWYTTTIYQTTTEKSSFSFSVINSAIGGDTYQPAFIYWFLNYTISVGFRNFIFTRTYDNVIRDISFL